MSTMNMNNSVVSAGGPSKGVSIGGDIALAKQLIKDLLDSEFDRKTVYAEVVKATELLPAANINALIDKASLSSKKASSEEDESDVVEEEDEEVAPVAPVQKSKKASSSRRVERELMTVAEWLDAFDAIMEETDPNAVGGMPTTAFRNNVAIQAKTNKPLPSVNDGPQKLIDVASKRAETPNAFTGVDNVLMPLAKAYCALTNWKKVKKSLDDDALPLLTASFAYLGPRDMVKYLKNSPSHKYSRKTLADMVSKINLKEAGIRATPGSDDAETIAVAMFRQLRPMFGLKV